MMNQLFLHKGKVALQQVPIPQCSRKQILVQVYYSFVSSGTESATINNSSQSIFNKFTSNTIDNSKKIIGAIKENGVYVTEALIKGKLVGVNNLGYSCSGKIIAVGSDVSKFKVGDFVACAGSGFATHSEVVSVPANLAVKLPEESFIKDSSITTIGTIALQGIRRANLQLGERVCILGLGLIGQISVQLAKLAGCQVFGVDLQQDRLDIASSFGADYIYNPTSVDLKKEIDFATSHYGVDVTIITAASSSGMVIQQAMEVTRRKGRVVLVGDVKLDFNRDPFYSKEIDFLISCSYGPGRYDNSYEKEGIDYPHSYVRWTQNRNMELFVDLIKDKKVDVAPLVSQEFDIQEADKAYQYLRKKNLLGVVLSYDKNKREIFLQELDALLSQQDNKGNRVVPYRACKLALKTAFIGVGGFAKVKLLPILSRNYGVDIHTIVDTDSTNLINMGRVYGAKRAINDYKKVVFDDDINMVVIATPHHNHLEQSLDCLSAGKAVFVEKPASINFEQYKTLEAFFKNNRDSFYCVDFNRSFAPFNISIKESLKKRTSPLIINYRMNVGFIPKEHWVQSKFHGGRIIGEACHIFELFSFLTDAKPVSVSVESLNHFRDDFSINDNAVIQLGMSDGSCCSLTYTALGSSSMEKERMEIFFEGKSILMHDYKILKGFGLPVTFNQKVHYADKGHEKLLKEFVTAARRPGGESPVPIERILNATKVSIIVDQLVREGGGRSLL